LEKKQSIIMNIKGSICLGVILSAMTHGAELVLNENICEFDTGELKGRIGDGRFIGVNQLVHKPGAIKVSGDKAMNRHGLAARKLLSRPPQRGRSERGSASGSEGV